MAVLHILPRRWLHKPCRKTCAISEYLLIGIAVYTVFTLVWCQHTVEILHKASYLV